MQLTPITFEQFATKSWRRSSNYGFAAKSNILPITAAELAKLVPVMPLGFVQQGDLFQIVSVTGLQAGSNFFVMPDGKWMGDYVPAVLRTFPFQMVKPQDREEHVLCIDSDSGLICEKGEGEAFFDDAGSPSPVIKDILTFLSQIETSRVMTQTAVNALQSANLIQPWQFTIQQGKKTVSVEGLFRVDEAVLNSLQDDQFLMLRKTGALHVAYSQLLSMNQLDMLQKAAGAYARLNEHSLLAINAAYAPSPSMILTDNDIIKFSF